MESELSRKYHTIKNKNDKSKKITKLIAKSSAARTLPNLIYYAVAKYGENYVRPLQFVGVVFMASVAYFDNDFLKVYKPLCDLFFL